MKIPIKSQNNFTKNHYKNMKKIIKINDGLTIDLEICRAIITPLFGAYDPFRSRYYSDMNLTNDLHLDFEENDDGEFVCVSIYQNPGIYDEKIKSLALDVAHIVKAIMNGMEFAFKNVISFRAFCAEEIAKDMGYRNGKGSAGWICQEAIGGRCRDGDAIPNAKRILKMYDDGDPQFYDMIPMSPLSYEWADDMSIKEVICYSLKLDADDLEEFHKICESLGMECEFDSLKDSLCRQYEEAFQDSCIQEIIDQCRLTIS